MKQHDCIFIPGGGLLPDGSLPLWTIARLQSALVSKSQTRMFCCLSGGTVHKPPPVNKEGYPIFESRAAAAYLVSQGIAPQRILTEICSYDTIGNAYFSRILFTDPLGFTNLLMITSEFHLERTQTVFKWLYSLKPRSKQYTLSFESVPDTGLSPQVLEARKMRERQSLERLKTLQNKITTLSDFHRWFYTKHQAYAVQTDPEKLSGKALESY